MTDFSLILFTFALFAGISAAAYVVLSAVATRVQVEQRLRSGAVQTLGSDIEQDSPFAGLAQANEKIFAIDPAKMSKLRLDLQRAGFFGARAPQLFLLLRTFMIVYLPLVGYLGVQFLLPSLSGTHTLLVTLGFVFAGYLLPQAGLDRLRAWQEEEYRLAFPDLLDMLLVCVDAGLSFEGALQRLASQFMTRSKGLGYNLQMLSSELRAGRSLADAMDGFGDRLGLDEARSFATLLKQSIELGSDIGAALRVYGDEMRDKRAMRAEEKANRLPVLMVIPLGLFIFPVVLTILMYPAIVRLMDSFKNFIGG